MKRLVLFLLLFCSFSYAQTTPIPDNAFEQILVDLNIDSNGLNGNILDTDAAAITNLNLPGNTITDLTGLEAFVNLVSLNLNAHQFPTIPTITMPNLEVVRFNGNVNLTNVDFSQNLNLREISFQSPASTINGIPPITTIDLSNNTQLEDIQIIRLRDLSSLNLPSASNAISSIQLQELGLANIDLSNQNALTNFSLRGSEVSVNIIFPSVFTVLENINIRDINFNTIDISNYVNLITVEISDTNVQNLLLPNSTTLQRLIIRGHNFINPISLASIPNVTQVTITNAQSVPLVIDLTQNTQIENLNLFLNMMNSIDLSQNTNLVNLSIFSNNLTNLDLSQNTSLGNVNAGSNQLPNLDVTNNINLTGLSINNNLFTNNGLDLSQNSNLAVLNISNNQVQSLDISNTNMVSFLGNNNLFSGTDILDQLFILKSVNGIGASNTVDVSFNNLSGPMPDFASLVGSSTNFFRFRFNDNAFEFGDFENQHNQYVNFLNQTNTFGSTELPIMTEYDYAPQAKVNDIENFTINAGDAITLETIVSGAENHYTWFKDGVPIPGAPDSPQLVIDPVNPCDSGVYHAEVTSDLVPFDNGDPPGTNGKNLVLVRNDITLEVLEVATSSCPNLFSPVDGSIDNPINALLEWTPDVNACGYFINAGTTSGGTDILNNFDVGDTTSYLFNPNLPPNSTVYISIIPYFQDGSTLNSCSEFTFDTGTDVELPNCTTLISPLNGATDVAVNTSLAWNAVASATGYLISIGTSSGATDIVNNQDVGNVTSFNPTTDFPESTTIFVTITPYNSAGNATGCVEESFTTETLVTIPNCTTLISPLNGAIDVAVNTNIAWNAVAEATGYLISIGTSSGATDIVNNQDVGNVTSFNPTTDFPESTTIFVTITPYNSAGNTTGCVEESFTTETLVTIPNCTTLSLPLDGTTDVAVNTNLEWNALAEAAGYLISIGTSSGATDIVNNLDVGNVTSFNPTTDFPESTTIFVTIMPYNSSGNATGCVEESFTTETLVTIPNCTTLISPLNGATDVAVNTSLEWNAVSSATGYLISIGTSSGATDIVNNQDVGNVTSFTPPTDLPQNATIYLTITPYNSVGNATRCNQQRFNTQSKITIPQFFTPNSDGFNDVWKVDDPQNLVESIQIFDKYGKLLKFIDADLTWDGIFNGKALPSSDYWYRVNTVDGRILRGNVTLKR
jgi:gliding motility-associated-like protein